MRSSLLSTTSFLLAVALLLTSVGATPLHGIPEIAERSLETRAVTRMSAADISSFTPFTQFARAAYCPRVGSWSCGGKLNLFRFDRDRWLDGLVCLVAETCNAVPGFQPTLTGGDGAAVPFCECLDINASSSDVLWGLWVCAYFRLSSFCWILAATELCNCLPPGDRSNYNVRLL